MSTTPKTPFGRALTSIRMMRSQRVEQLADQVGMAAGTMGGVKTGKRYVDGALVRRLVHVLGTSPEETQRLAAGMAATGYGDGDVRYDIAAGTAAAHAAAALVSIYSGRLSDDAWERIASLVQADIEASEQFAAQLAADVAAQVVEVAA